jgi:TrmH RNA methyltransferase
MKSRPTANFKKRGPSSDRGRGSFGPKKEGRWGRSERPSSERGERPERRERSDRGFRADRGPGKGRDFRSDRSRPFSGPRSGPREDRGPRDDRAPREERRTRDDRGPREERGPRREGSFGPKRSFRGPDENRGSRPFGGGGGFRGPREDRRERPSAAGPVPQAEGATDFREEKKFRPHLADDEMRYLGANSCLAVWKFRPKDLIRVYIQKDLSDKYAALLEFCAKNKKSYHLVSVGELEKLTDSKHHEGICVVAKEKRTLRENDFFRLLDGSRQLILYLDGVGNPHNLGAILRTAAHFGVNFVCGERAELPRISPAAHRTSEGGAEHASLVLVEEPERFFDRLKGLGFQVYAFDPNAQANSLFESRIAERAVFVMGAEGSGVSGLIHALADAKLKITGTGAVESLNVSVAAALAMAEFHRQGKQGSVRIVKKT